MDYSQAYDYGYYYSYQPSPFMSFVNLALTVLLVASMWKLFQKAGKEGWESIVPFYNVYVMFNIVGQSGWRIFTLLIPFYNIYVIFKLYIDLAKSFGKSGGYGLGLVFLPWVFMPILAFGDAQYTGPANVAPATEPATQPAA